jgi:hypothetical protein
MRDSARKQGVYALKFQNGHVAQIHQTINGAYQHLAAVWYYLPGQIFPYTGINRPQMDWLLALVRTFFQDLHYVDKLVQDESLLSDCATRAQQCLAFIQHAIHATLAPAKDVAKQAVGAAAAALKSERGRVISGMVVAEAEPGPPPVLAYPSTHVSASEEDQEKAKLKAELQTLQSEMVAAQQVNAGSSKTAAAGTSENEALKKQMAEMAAKMEHQAKQLEAHSGGDGGAAEVLIKHQEQQANAEGNLSTARAQQQAKMRARVAERKTAREAKWHEEKAAVMEKESPERGSMPMPPPDAGPEVPVAHG